MRALKEQHRKVTSVSVQKHCRKHLKRRPGTRNTSDSRKVLDRTDRKQHELNTNMEEIFVSPDCFDFLDDLLLFCIFRRTTVLRERGYGYGRAEHVKVIVMSTLLSREPFRLPCDETDHVLVAKLQNSVFVGQVQQSPLGSSLRKGTLVTSLRTCPIHTQVLNLPVDAVIPIPDRIDTGEAATVVSTFTPAMGMLFHGRDDRSTRFSDSSLKGLDILVTGGGSDEADALVHLALLGGANRVFVLQSKLSLAPSHAHSVRVELVSDNPDEWRPFIDRFMDLIIDFEYPKNFEALYGILKNTGRLVCRKPLANGFLAPCKAWWDELCLLKYPNACIYDIEDQIENEHAEMVRDIRYLFGLLERRKIRPVIDKSIRVLDIDSIREHMRYNPGTGAVVCEPWR